MSKAKILFLFFRKLSILNLLSLEKMISSKFIQTLV